MCLCVLLFGIDFQMNGQEVKQIILPNDTSRLLSFSAKEVQKYIYLRTKLFVPIQLGKTGNSFSKSIILREDNDLSAEEYSIERMVIICILTEDRILPYCMVFIHTRSCWVSVLLYMET